MSSIILVHCFNYKDDNTSRATIPCDSNKSATYWAEIYRAAGWISVWINGWQSIETLPNQLKG